MKTLTGNVILATLTLAAFGASPVADLGAKTPLPIAGSGTGLGKTRVPPMTWLGVSIAEAPIEISGRLAIEPGTGLVVDQVIANSPAAIAGLQRNDVLARLNDQTLVTVKQLQTLVQHRKVGEQVELTYFRKGEKRRVAVVLMPRERM